MNFDALFAALDQRPVQPVDTIPGITLHMRPLSVAERDAVHRKVLGDKYDRKGVPAAELNAHSVAAVLCEPDGARFSEADSKTLVDKLLGGSSPVFDKLVAKANEVSGLNASVEDAEKNSPTAES